MLFSRIASFFVLSFALGTFAAAKPIGSVVTGGDVASVGDVLRTLKSKVDINLRQLENLTTGGNVSDASVGPLVSELTSALQSSKSSLTMIGPIAGTPTRAQVVGLISEIVQEIDETLKVLLANSTAITYLPELLYGVDIALAEVLIGLGMNLSGVITDVATLLSGLTNSLKAVNLTETLAILEL